MSAGGHGWPQRLRRESILTQRKRNERRSTRRTSSRIDVCKDVEEEKDELMVC